MSNHSIGDLILEGVANSAESGANEVVVFLDICIDMVKVRIEDNGVLVKGDFFSPGFSTKGDNRGMGLKCIADRDQDAKLYSENGKTILDFKVRREPFLEKLEDVLFPIFQLCEQTTFHYLIEGVEVFALTERGENLTKASRIAEFKDLVRSKERSIGCQNSH